MRDRPFRSYGVQVWDFSDKSVLYNPRRYFTCPLEIIDLGIFSVFRVATDSFARATRAGGDLLGICTTRDCGRGRLMSLKDDRQVFQGRMLPYDIHAAIVVSSLFGTPPSNILGADLRFPEFDPHPTHPVPSYILCLSRRWLGWY